MQNFTLNNVLKFIESDIRDVLRNLSQDEINELTAEDVVELLDENSYFAPEVTEVIYYADAWEVVAGSSFNDYSADYLDFSNCKNAIDCVMHEAQGIIDSVYYQNRDEIAQNVLDELQSND